MRAPFIAGLTVCLLSCGYLQAEESATSQSSMSKHSGMPKQNDGCRGMNVPGNEIGQRQLNECFENEYEDYKRQLEDILSEIYARKNLQNSGLLKEAQQAWGNYLIKQCNFQTAISSSGSIYPMAYYICLEDKTKIRIKELKYQLNCESGDATCNGYQDSSSQLR